MKRLVLVALAAMCAVRAFGLTEAEYDRLRESLKAPKLHPGITWAQLQQLHKQWLSKMYVVRGGKEWIQVRGWRPSTCELYELPAWREIPKAYEVEIHRVEPSGNWFARITKKDGPDSGKMGKVVPMKGMEGAAGDTKTLWLVERFSGERAKNEATGYTKTFDVWDVVSEETAASYRVPTAREVALAMRDKGKTFVVRMPVFVGPCPSCEGSGELVQEIEPSLTLSVKESEESGRGNFLRGPSLSQQLAEKRAKQPHSLKQPCPECDGSGKIYAEEFRTLIFKKRPARKK